MLTDAELKDLSRRALMSAQRGYKVARGDKYAKALSEETGLDLGGSASDLVELCKAALAKRGGKPVEAKKKPAPPPEVTPPEEDEEETEDEPTDEAEEESEDESEAEGGYETWTRDALYEEAKSREIEGRSDMNKADLVAALEADDKVEV